MKKFLCNRVLFCLLAFFLITPAFSIPFTDFDFDAPQFDEETELEFEEYTIKISELKRKGNSISCQAEFFFGDETKGGELYFKKFTLNRDGSFKSGYSDYDGSVYYNEELYLFLDKAVLEKSEDSYILKCNKADLGVPYIFGEKNLATYKITVDMQGNILTSSSSLAKSLKLATYDVFDVSVNLNSIMYNEDNVICANGEISIPKLNLYVKANNHEIVYSDFAFIASFAEPFNFSNGSDIFSARSITMQSNGRKKYWFDDVILTHNNHEYPFEKLWYLSYGSDNTYLESDICDWKDEYGEGEGFLLPDDKILNYYYDYNDFSLVLLSRFPKANEHYLKVDVSTKNGKYVYSRPYGPEGEKYFMYGNTRVQPAQAAFGLKESLIHFNSDTDEYEISRGKVIFPENCILGPFVINWTNIDTKGNVHFGGELPGTIDFCNNAFEPKTIKFTDDGIRFTGLLYLNTQRRVSVNELLIGYDGTVKSFETRHFGYDENVIAQEFYVTSQSSYLMVEQEQYPDGTLSKPILWQVFEDSEISTDRMPRPVPIKDLRQNHSETSLRFFSREYPFEQYYERLEREGGR